MLAGVTITTPGGRTRQVGDAAIAVLAGQGARGLTHRAVDRAAGLPPGTTSNYARTREALLTLALARIAELDATQGAAGLYENGISGPGMSGPGMSASGASASGASGSGASGSGASGPGMSGSELAEGLARMLHRMISDPGARRRTRARFELALEATRRPELRAAYDEMGRAFRIQAVRLLAAAGSAHPERAAWTLIAWVEGTAFYALAGAGGTAVPSLAELRAQVTNLLAGLCGDDDAGAA
ncbi:MAG TPA: TetR family transcriptional regulator C-terminal domain-containing protein [Streptosporangiaceae bacterium]